MLIMNFQMPLHNWLNVIRKMNYVKLLLLYHQAPLRGKNRIDPGYLLLLHLIHVNQLRARQLLQFYNQLPLVKKILIKLCMRFLMLYYQQTLHIMILKNLFLALNAWPHFLIKLLPPNTWRFVLFQIFLLINHLQLLLSVAQRLVLFFARCESTIFTDFPVNFSSPAHTLLAIRILPFDVSDGVIQFLSKLLMHLLQDTTFSKILKAQTQQGGLGYLLSALTAMAQDSGGGNAAVPVLGNHASLHIALATIHKLYSYIAPKFSHQEHKLLLKHASDLKQRLRNELDPMAVRTNDIMESFLAGLRRDSEPPVKKQGRLTFTSAKVITAAD
mmetsp:Transcript_18825/g.23156  ORF Transcript_18825/g.23156 Transcript_18825/m.23156 type:complete len:329 (+) Transcript_18825:468-1454(+)